MTFSPSRPLRWPVAFLLLVVGAVGGAAPASAQFDRSMSGVQRAQEGASPRLQVVERTDRSVTYELRARWTGRLAEAASSDVDRTVLAAVGGMPWLTEVLALAPGREPRVTILSADFDEVPLPFAAQAVAETPIVGQPVTVERVGVERRRATGTLVVRLLQVDADRGLLRRYDRLTFRVDFGGSTSAIVADDPQNPHLNITQSVLATGTWYKVPVRREGVVRIDRAFLSQLGVNPNSLDPNQVKVFGNSGAPLPALNSAPRIPDLAENPVLVVGGGDGRFDDGDAVYFFARASSGWRWATDESPAAWRHYINPFSFDNYYFIRVDGPASRQISTAPVPGGTPKVRDVVEGRIFAEEDLPTGMIDREGGGSGLDWLGRDITRTRNRITVLDTLPPDIAEGVIRYRGRMALRSNVAGPLAFMRDQTVFASAHLGAYSHNNVAFSHATRQWTEPASPGQRLRIDLQLNINSGSPTGFIDYVAAVYPKRLQAVNDYLRFATPGGEAGPFEFVMTGFTGEPQVWDVTDVGETRRLQVTGDGSTYRVRVHAPDENRPREIVAFRAASSQVRSLSAARAEPVQNQNLHGLAFHPDYVIVTADELLAPAQVLAEHRAGRGLTPLVVSIRQIYNEFSGGLVDPRGLRDFLRFLYDRGPGAEPTLRYVLLLGDGNYDYRGIRPGGRENNLVPTFQSENSASYVQSYTSDDYFGLLEPHEGQWTDNTERVDLGIGRLPVRNAQEAADMVAKIKRYEDPATLGSWRTRYTLLADDHLPNPSDRDTWVFNAEVVGDTVAAHAPGMNFEKIYMSTYKLQQTAQGARYPEATADAVRTLEEGTLVWNYTGHGGPPALADERLITRDDIRSLTNFDRLTTVVTVTCTFGRYDLREERSGGEEFVLNPHGGAVAIFTTSRLVHGSVSPTAGTLGLNVVFNRTLFGRDEQGRPRRMGDIYRLAKAHTVGATLDGRKFNLLGDPGLRFGMPERAVAITEINNVPLGGDASRFVASVTEPDVALPRLAEMGEVSELGLVGAGRLATQPAAPQSQTSMPELRALELATIRGEVFGVNGLPDPSFSGEVEVLVYDVERTRTLPAAANAQYTDGTFLERSDLIHRGRASVSAGQWELQFIVPQDISYAGGAARVAAYVAGVGSDGKGFTEDVLIGTQSGPPLNDTQGPRIRLFLNDTTFVHGGLSGDEPLLIARLSDESGINMAGVGVGHEMLLVINGNEAGAVNVGHFYQSDLDTYQSGTLRYRLPPLGSGPHTLSLTAWDVVNNSATATLDFVVEDSDRLRIEHAYPYPNPTPGPTRFVFEHNQAPGTAANVQIRIYTINGRPVRTLDGAETLPEGVLTGSPVQIPWDGRDEDFDELATGIYLYRVRVEVDHGDGERRVAERIERLAIIR